MNQGDCRRAVAKCRNEQPGHCQDSLYYAILSSSCMLRTHDFQLAQLSSPSHPPFFRPYIFSHFDHRLHECIAPRSTFHAAQLLPRGMMPSTVMNFGSRAPTKLTSRLPRHHLQVAQTFFAIGTLYILLSPFWPFTQTHR